MNICCVVAFVAFVDYEKAFYQYVSISVLGSLHDVEPFGLCDRKFGITCLVRLQVCATYAIAGIT